MRRFFLVCAVVAMAACGGGGDDDGGGGGDAAGGGDATGGGDGGGPDGGGGGNLTASTDFANPTDIDVGETGGGTVAGLDNHFWRFTPTATANYVITLTGDVHASVNWCGNSGTENGCLCDTTPEVPACCDVASASCTALVTDATSGDDGIFVVFAGGPDPVEYTVTIAAE